jgi:RNA polymerase sigma factor (TIGR02999 family)
VDTDKAQHWNSRGHFFVAAAEAMRRILVERARRKRRPKHGGDHRRVDLDVALLVTEVPAANLLALDESLRRLEATDPLTAKLIQLRYFASLSMPEAAEMLGISLRTAERNWTYARTWLYRELAPPDPTSPPDHAF